MQTKNMKTKASVMNADVDNLVQQYRHAAATVGDLHPETVDLGLDLASAVETALGRPAAASLWDGCA